MNAQKEKNFRGSCKSMKKCAMKMKQTRKNDTHIKIYINGRKPFIRPLHKTGENDLQELQVNDYGYNEGTINFV